ncbi:MAG TPA: hypothetical protein VGL02_21285, partial [Streptomyces sp.]
AARGDDHPRIAAALGTGEREVVRLLSAVYRKLGTDPSGLPEAFREPPPPEAPPAPRAAAGAAGATGTPEPELR